MGERKAINGCQEEARVSIIQKLESADVEDDFGLMNACIQCIDTPQSAILLAKEAERVSRLRNGLLRKVLQDIRREILPEHIELVEILIARLEVSDVKGRQGIGFCLSKILEEIPQELRLRVQSVFLESRFVGLRRRGYKAISYDDSPRIDFLKKAWRDFQDSECAWLMVKLMPVQELYNIRKELLEFLPEGWQVSRLYLRLADFSESVLSELREIDGVCYSYVIAKLGRTLAHEDARELIRQYETDDRFGLLIWSFGQMGLWDTLMWLKDQLVDIKHRRHQDMVERFGV